MNDHFIEAVYQTLTGQLLPQYRIPGVENAFAPGSKSSKLYQRIYNAKLRLCQRLGVTDDDADIEDIANAYGDIMEYLCAKMYAYGCVYREIDTTVEPIKSQIG